MTNKDEKLKTFLDETTNKFNKLHKKFQDGATLLYDIILTNSIHFFIVSRYFSSLHTNLYTNIYKLI